MPEFELPNLWLVSLQMVFWLIVVVVLIVACVWVMKKVTSPTRKINNQKPIRLLFQETIAPGRSICLVRVLNQVHVVGVTNSQISYLATLDETESDAVSQGVVDDFFLDYRLKNGFGLLLNRVVGKK